MREIDEVRITLLRALRQHSTNHPNSGNYSMMHLWDNHLGIVKSINRILQDRFKLLSSIKLQAYGRGLLVRLRDLKLVTTRTQHFSGGYHFSGLRIKWDHDKLVERARGDPALRRSRTALETPKSAIWRGSSYDRRMDDYWLYGRRYGVPKDDYGAFFRRPKVWERWITRRSKVEAHYFHRHRLGVKLLDFGEP